MNLLFVAFKTLVLVLLLPPTPFLLMMLAGWYRRQRRGAFALVLTGVLGSWLSCTEGAGEFLTRTLLHPPPALNPATLAGGPPTAVLVLGAGVRNEVPEYRGPGLKPLTAERLHYGVWLARQGGWPLGFTGGIGWLALDQVKPEAEVAALSAQQHYGVTLRWAEGHARDTRENAANSLPMLAASGIRRVIVVTHDSHMPRALRAFEGVAQALDLEIIPAPLGGVAHAYGGLEDWYPTVPGYARVRYAIHEWLAALTGR